MEGQLSHRLNLWLTVADICNDLFSESRDQNHIEQVSNGNRSENGQAQPPPVEKVVTQHHCEKKQKEYNRFDQRQWPLRQKWVDALTPHELALAS